MALKLVLDSLDDLTDEEKKLYVEKDKKFYLDIEGEAPSAEELKKEKEKLKEFRDNNIKLTKEIEELKANAEKFKDIDPKKYKELIKKLQDIDEQKLIEKGKIDELFAQKTERLRADKDAQILALEEAKTKTEKDLAKVKSQLATVTIDNAIQLSISKHTKPRKDTMIHIVTFGRKIFSVDEEGKPIARDEKGEMLFSKDGSTPLSIEEWAQNLPAEAPFFFEPSEGSGAEGGAGGELKGITAKQLADLPPTERLKVIHDRGGKK